MFPNAEKPPPLPGAGVEALLVTAAAAAANGEEVLLAKALKAPVAGLIRDEAWPNAGWPKADVAAAAGVAVCPKADCPNAG